MQIIGKRIHIAGSASSNTSTSLLNYAHELVDLLVKSLAVDGASFVISGVKEPYVNDDRSLPSIVFDWTVIEAAYDCLRNGKSRSRNSLIAMVGTSKTLAQIPEWRAGTWNSLLAAGAIELHYLEDGWTSGALRRSREAELGDVLIILGGGEGVEHLAKEYALQGKPVIPLDIELGSSMGDGSGGAARLAGVMRAHPERFINLVEPKLSGSLIARLSTRQGKTSPKDVVAAINEIILALARPMAFYVRLLNESAPHFAIVEAFFRGVVDPLVDSKGYDVVEMGRSANTYPWMNQQIFSALYSSTIVVVDLTGLRPNCFMELGYALGLPRKVLITARSGTKPPFDASALEWYLWKESTPNDQRIKKFDEYWGRCLSRPPLVMPRSLL